MPWPAPTDDELARAQAAIGDAYDQWCQDVARAGGEPDDDVDDSGDFEDAPRADTEHDELMDATGDQLADLWKRIEDAAAGARAPA